MASYPVLNIPQLNSFIDSSTYASQLHKVYINNSGNPTQSSASTHTYNYLCFNSSNISTIGEEKLFKHTVPVLSSYTSSLKSLYVSWPSDSKILATTANLKYKDLEIPTITYNATGAESSSPLNIYCKYPLYQNISGYVDSITTYLPSSSFIYGTYGPTITYSLHGSDITLPSGIFSFPPAYDEANLFASAPNIRSWQGLSPATSYANIFNNYKFLLIEINFYSAWINDTLDGSNTSSLPANNYTSFTWANVLSLTTPSKVNTAITNGINSFKSKSSGSNNNATAQVYYGNLTNLCLASSIGGATTWASGEITKKSSSTRWVLPNQPYLYTGTITIPSQTGEIDYDWGLSSSISSNNTWTYTGNDPQNSAISTIISGLRSAGMSTTMKNNVTVLHEVYLLSSADIATADAKILFKSTEGDTNIYLSTIDGLFPFIVRSFILIGTDILINATHFNQPLWEEDYYPWGYYFDIRSLYSKYFLNSGSSGDSSMFNEMNACCPNYRVNSQISTNAFFIQAPVTFFANAWTPN